MIKPTAGHVERPATIYTVGEALAQWRAAERKLEEVEAGAAEWQAVQADITSLRERYQRLFAAKQQSGRAIN